MPKLQCSLIFTVLNEGKSIERFLNSLSSLSLKPSHIVCVDGGSTDLTYSHLENWNPPDGVSYKVIQSHGLNISQGRNLAIENCSEGVIVVADAGTTINENWFKQLVIPFEDPSIDVSSGWYEPLPGTFWQTLIGSLTAPLLDEIDSASFLPSSRSVAFRKSAWESVGGYPEWLDYCEDLVFDLALKTKGATFGFAPDAVVRWNARDSLLAFSKQYYRYARGDGKAALWAKRHIARYGFYFSWLLVGLLWNSLAGACLTAMLSLASIFYLQKFYRRLIVRRSSQNLFSFIAGLLLSPFVVMIGDVSKMVGYPVGLVWRTKRKFRHSDE
jgi:glycosyltransferase involved in cell wall biosynthesis